MQFTANREPRTANREQSSLNFFNFFKDKFLFIRICLALLFQKFNINLVKSFIKENTLKAGRRQIIRSFFVEKKNQKTTTFFVKKVDKKTTPFRIRNSLVKTFLQYSESPSLRGFVAVGVPLAKNRSNLLYLDCRDFGRSLAMTIKNNFANLNLVKTFLTSITFDSLSEKIKNLRLVIKKLKQWRIFK